MTDAAEIPPPAGPPAAPPPLSPRLVRERIVVVVLLVGVVILALAKHVLHTDALIAVAAIVPSIILHEISHGAVAYAFGDDTAKRAHRLTLNPLAHIDPMGTVIMPTLLVLSGAPPIGFAKPVPVNLSKLRSPRNHGLLVALAGPSTNFVLSLAAAAAWRIVHPHTFDNLATFIFDVGVLNALLGVFNLLPIPPLDGSGLLERVLPQAWWPSYLRFRQYSMLLLLVVFFGFHHVIDTVLNPVFHVWARLAGL